MAADAPVYTAECLCKACAVTLRGNPGWAVYCHCSQCRRALGADYATLVGGAVDAITPVRGEFKSFSTGKEERYSCPTCFSTVWADLHHLNARAIYNTAFVQPNHGPDGAITLAAFTPSMHIFVRARARARARAEARLRVSLHACLRPLLLTTRARNVHAPLARCSRPRSTPPASRASPTRCLSSRACRLPSAARAWSSTTTAPRSNVAAIRLCARVQRAHGDATSASYCLRAPGTMSELMAPPIAYLGRRGFRAGVCSGSVECSRRVPSRASDTARYCSDVVIVRANDRNVENIY